MIKFKYTLYNLYIYVHTVYVQRTAVYTVYTCIYTNETSPSQTTVCSGYQLPANIVKYAAPRAGAILQQREQIEAEIQTLVVFSQMLRLRGRWGHLPGPGSSSMSANLTWFLGLGDGSKPKKMSSL